MKHKRNELGVIRRFSSHFPAPPCQTADFAGNLNKKTERLASNLPTALHPHPIYPQKSKNVTTINGYHPITLSLLHPLQPTIAISRRCMSFLQAERLCSDRHQPSAKVSRSLSNETSLPIAVLD